MSLAIRLSFWVLLALLSPLLLGLLLDIALGVAPKGLLCGSALGALLASAIVIRTIQLRYQTLAPPEINDKENA